MNWLFHWDHFKEDQMEFYQLYIYFSFSFYWSKIFKIRLTVDEWIKTQWKRMMKETIRIINKKSVDWLKWYKQDKLNRWLKRSEWIKCFRDWWFQTDWSCSNFIISFLPFIEKCRIKNWQIKRKSLFYI